MIADTSRVFHHRVLIVDDQLAQADTAAGRSVRALVDELCERSCQVVEALSLEDGIATVASDAGLHCIFVNWTLGRNDDQSHAQATKLLRHVREGNAKIPVFLMADRTVSGSIGAEVGTLADEFVWLLGDTAAFIAGRAEAAIERYLDQLLPPYASALMRYNRAREYSWAAPGHQGGVAFLKSPVGRLFFDYFGENLFRSDMGIERGALGSLLGHGGPVGASERNIARIFGAQRSYTVLGGTSASNRAIITACVGENEIVLADRNCHKSIEQGLALSGGVPVFFNPTRNRFGIIGPIPPDQFDPAAVNVRIGMNALARAGGKKRAVYSVITNCTYDGMCYDATRVQELLGRSVDRIHFDEAWYGYARFNDMYRDRYAMRGDPKSHVADSPTVFATHSTHKLLAALSQTSFIHVRDGRGSIDHGRFNEAYCAQASTSPLYALIASNDIAAAMMDGPGGKVLTQECIDEAIACRLALARLRREFAAKEDWFFSPWNAETVTYRQNARRIPFEQAPPEMLAVEPACWVLEPGERWHGFEHLPKGYCMLDPIKLGVVCPGMRDDGILAEQGVPADLVSAYLARVGIVPSRTTDHMVLFLFSMGVTKGKWGSLITTLLDFKVDYDRNTPLEQALPTIVAVAPQRYSGLGLRDLGDQMWARMRTTAQAKWQAQAYAQLPTPHMTPRRAFQALMAGNAEKLPLDALAGRVAGVGVIPYPPGIPIVMPGEEFGPRDGPWLSYLRLLQNWGRLFPGFGKEVEGTEEIDHAYHVYCLRP
jgi:arginine decarboxylase